MNNWVLSFALWEVYNYDSNLFTCISYIQIFYFFLSHM